MSAPLAPSVREKLRSIFKSNDTYLKALESARRNLITYFNRSKLHSLFIKAIDNCSYVDFASTRDRRVNKNLPVYKLKIAYSNIPPEVRAKAQTKKRPCDAKAYIVHAGVLTPYLDILMDVIRNNDMEYLKEAIPTKEVKTQLADYISAMYVMDTSDDFEKPIFLRQII